MSLYDIDRRVKELISQQLGAPLQTVNDDSNLITDLGADSLDIVEMTMAFEDIFEVVISDEEFSTLRTVKDVVEYLKARVK